MSSFPLTNSYFSRWLKPPTYLSWGYHLVGCLTWYLTSLNRPKAPGNDDLSVALKAVEGERDFFLEFPYDMNNKWWLCWGYHGNVIAKIHGGTLWSFNVAIGKWPKENR